MTMLSLQFVSRTCLSIL